MMLASVDYNGKNGDNIMYILTPVQIEPLGPQENERLKRLLQFRKNPYTLKEYCDLSYLMLRTVQNEWESEQILEHAQKLITPKLQIHSCQWATIINEINKAKELSKINEQKGGYLHKDIKQTIRLDLSRLKSMVDQIKEKAYREVNLSSREIQKERDQEKEIDQEVNLIRCLKQMIQTQGVLINQIRQKYPNKQEEIAEESENSNNILGNIKHFPEEILKEIRHKYERRRNHGDQQIYDTLEQLMQLRRNNLRHYKYISIRQQVR